MLLLGVAQPLKDRWSRVSARSLALLILSALLLSGCETSVSSGNGKSDVFEFPVADGSWWHYNVHSAGGLDTTRAHPDCDFSERNLTWEFRDTISIFIDGTDTLEVNGEVASVLRFSRDTDIPGYWFDRFLVTGVESSDSTAPISFYLFDGSEKPAFFFQRPIEDGAKWLCLYCRFNVYQDYQRYTVAYVPELETPVGDFEAVFKVTHSYDCATECGGQYSYWLKSGIGIVKMQRTLHEGMNYCGDPFSTITWELVDYEVK